MELGPCPPVDEQVDRFSAYCMSILHLVHVVPVLPWVTRKDASVPVMRFMKKAVLCGRHCPDLPVRENDGSIVKKCFVPSLATDKVASLPHAPLGQQRCRSAQETWQITTGTKNVPMDAGEPHSVGKIHPCWRQAHCPGRSWENHIHERSLATLVRLVDLKPALYLFVARVAPHCLNVKPRAATNTRYLLNIGLDDTAFDLFTATRSLPFLEVVWRRSRIAQHCVI
mmetsp:Transcript_60666/g.141341  ORF Transcript_60666/g.141341 Transcript_60666/m.141341 type:complete len:226 (+) Transcript_60666:244-921(+)|eukprot:CAMPEP_0171094936 /NCGR_PEP_ID=MMETSP0766_2-20121228/42888_1 /TAXON_ID=439317 /ORGANISM="Gambierdiscus australes, Strain CAWD 149" /LENGTH=225 /DNA_ID=CAMNT_0011553685 /DNA_START=241 /DNA_END=918 /DNA_ORIENTATION=+